MTACLQELCSNWDGDGRHCICERLGVDPEIKYEGDDWWTK